MTRVLSHWRVIEQATGLSGPYCGKLLADAGADVVKLEPPGGDPLRGWSASGADLGDRDGALFRYVNAGKRSVVGEIGSAETDALLDSADLLIEDLPPDALDREALRARHPGLVIVSITPYGLTGPRAGRPATEFVLQADAGSIGSRARPGQVPFQAGGRIVEWAGGCFASVAALAALSATRRSGRGEHIDFSLHEVAAQLTNTYLDLMWGILGRPPAEGAFPYLETPSVEPTADGFVGFTTYSAQQFSDFLLMIDRTDLRESGEWDAFAVRMARVDEWERVVHAWTRTRTTAEIVEQAQLLRVPVAPVQNGATVTDHEQVRARGVYAPDPSGDFLRPLPPYRIDEHRPEVPARAPTLGEHQGAIERRERPAPKAGSASPGALPLAGMRIIDCTGWWAGPVATLMLAHLGADVIHVESVQRIDGSRSIGGNFAAVYPDWWEASFLFLSANANKRGLALDLRRPEGQAVFERLIAGADALVENFSPRVMDEFGVDWARVQRLNPRCHYVRMPAFGLDGPWREHVGFASTMEQMSGLSWLTGHVEDQPRVQRGPCDPLAGMHAAFALLVAMEARERSGRGHFVECAMLEAALNITAEQVVEHSAYGAVLERRGNRGFEAAPQGLYACRGHHLTDDPRWLALSVETEAQWQALRDWVGDPGFAKGVAGDLASRQAAHDALDEALRPLFAERDLAECVEQLIAAGVPASAVADPRSISAHPQMVARGFFEEIDHPTVGPQRVMGAPFRMSGVSTWLRRAAPTLGEHDDEILAELGYDQDAIEALRAADVIGRRPLGVD